MREVTQRLEQELKALEREFRVELPKEIRTAVAMGDLRENAEYKAALERQAYVRARISQLRERLAAINSLNLNQIPHGKIGMGTIVSLADLDTDGEVTYELVFPELADLDKGMLSIASPIGRALLGKVEGDEVEVKIPAGKRRFEVLGMQTLHDRKKD